MVEIPEINSYFQGINRGFLLYPNDITTNFVLYNYVVIDKCRRHTSHSSIAIATLFSWTTAPSADVPLGVF